MSIFSPVHIVFFAVIALLVLGPRRFPEFTRALGHGVRGFRDVLNGEVSRPRRVDEREDVTAGDGAAAGHGATAGQVATAEEATAGEATAGEAAAGAGSAADVGVSDAR
jgi:Sec-independent protein translocase protein TatA